MPGRDRPECDHWPYAVIGPHVRIGAGTYWGALRDRGTTIGGTTTSSSSRRWARCRRTKNTPASTRLVIGTATPSASSHLQYRHGAGQNCDPIGDDNWIMAYVHIAHDCVVGITPSLANNAALAGHVEVGDWATVRRPDGGAAYAIRRGRTMVGFASHIGRMFLRSWWWTATRWPCAVNLVGLRRRDFSAQRAWPSVNAISCCTARVDAGAGAQRHPAAAAGCLTRRRMWQ